MSQLAGRRIIVAGSMAACLAACGSGSGGERAALALQSGYSATFPATTGDLLDLGLPALHNNTSSAIQLTRVSLVDPGPVVRLVHVDAYNYAQVGSGVMSSTGYLPKDCPGKYVAHPVSAATVPAHADSAWFVIIELQAPKPGSYLVNKVRIDYRSGGHHYWQYQSLNTTLTIHQGAAESFPASECTRKSVEQLASSLRHRL